MSKTEMIKWLQNLKKDIGQSQHQDLWHYAEMLDEVIGTIESRPKGHWILSEIQDKEDTDNGNYRFECANCGYADVHSKATEVPYCWHCGADMRGGE